MGMVRDPGAPKGANLKGMSPDSAVSRIGVAVALTVREAARSRVEQESAGYPQTKLELQNWLYEATGWMIPAEAVCEDHDAPLDFLWDVFVCEVTDALVLANRGGGKTLNFALLHIANARWKKGHQTSHFGAIDRQAKRAYKYYETAVKREAFRRWVDSSRAQLSGTTWRNDSSIEILPATDAQSRGGHPNVVCVDEVESAKPQPYENTKAMPLERTLPDGSREPGQHISGSTRSDATGLMQKALDDADDPESEVAIFEWCIWDTMVACDLPPGHPFWEWLGPDGLSKASGWRSLADVERHFKRVDRDTWLAEYLNKKPNPRSLIYAKFGAPNITKEAEYVDGAGPIYLWYDWGFTDDSVFQFVQFRTKPTRFNVFHEIVGSGRAEREWVRECVKFVMTMKGYEGPDWEEWLRIWKGQANWPDPWPRVWPEAAGDPSAPQLRFEMREHGIGARDPKVVSHKVVVGQDVMRAAILTAGGARAFFVHPSCSVTSAAFKKLRARRLPDGSYSKEPDPRPENHVWSHPCDAARYGIWIHRRALGLEQYAGDGDKDSAAPDDVP